MDMDILKRWRLMLAVLTLVAACSNEDAATDPTPTLPDSAPTATDTPAPAPTTASTDTPAPTDTPPPTDAPKPTAALKPSSTAIITSIPVPTVAAPTVAGPTVAAPTAAVTSAPTPTVPPSAAPTQPPQPSENDAYLQELNAIFTAYPEAVNNLNGLMQDPRPDDAAWMQGMESNITAVKGVYENVRDMTPPTAMAGPHAALTDALGTCNGVADVALDGFRRQDRGTLEGAAGLADSCRDQLKGALDILNQHGAGMSAPPFDIPVQN